MKEPSLFRMKYRGLQVLMYSPADGRRKNTGGGDEEDNNSVFTIQKYDMDHYKECNAILTSLVEPALSDDADLVHAGLGVCGA